MSRTADNLIAKVNVSVFKPLCWNRYITS